MATLIPVFSGIITAFSNKLVDMAEVWEIHNGGSKTDLFRAVGSVCTVIQDPKSGVHDVFSFTNKTNLFNNLQEQLLRDPGILIGDQEHLVSLIIRYFKTIKPDLIAQHSRIEFFHGPRIVTVFRLETAATSLPTLNVNLLDLELEVKRIVRRYQKFAKASVNFLVTSALIITSFRMSKELRDLATDLYNTLFTPKPNRTIWGYLLGYPLHTPVSR
jgi:hypothetical protein